MKKLFFALLFISSLSYAQTDMSRIKKDIVYLSSDKLMGRFPGTKHELKAANYIAKEFKKLKLEPIAGTNSYLQDFPFKISTNPHASEDQTEPKGTAHNVIGFLNNNAEYTIVIGGHYDHLGLGTGGNSLDANPQNKIHNGADDNASGTAGVLELARYYVNNNIKEKHNYLFIAFSAEEEGLLGSKYFTNNPTLALNKISFMINMDMIGRLNETTNRIVISGVGTSPSIPKALLANENNLVKYKADSAGMGPSDHSSFYLKNIPALHFYTGTHTDYHKPSDDADKINFTGESHVLNFIIKITEELAKEDTLVFTSTKTNSNAASSVSFKVTLGVIPDYAFDGKGLRLDGVTEGKPAQKAGLKQGDIIIMMNEFTIENIQDYMKSLSKFQKGQTIQVKLKRENQDLIIPVTF